MGNQTIKDGQEIGEVISDYKKGLEREIDDENLVREMVIHYYKNILNSVMSNMQMKKFEERYKEVFDKDEKDK